MPDYLFEVTSKYGMLIDQTRGEHLSDLKHTACNNYGGSGATFECWTVMEDSLGDLVYVELIAHGELDED